MISLLLKTGFQCRLVIEWKKDDIVCLVHRPHDGRIIRDGDGQGCTSMERFGKSHHLLTSVMEGGQLQCILIGFGAGIAKKELVVFPSGYLPQLSRQFLLKGDADGVGVKTYLIQLIGDPADIMR